MIQGVKEDRKKRRKEEKKEVRYTYIQWNPSNIDSTSVHISEVFRGSIGNGVVLKRCPHFHLKKKEERERGGEKLERLKKIPFCFLCGMEVGVAAGTEAEVGVVDGFP